MTNSYRQNTGMSFWYPATLISKWYLWDIKMMSLWEISFWCPGMTSLGYLRGCHKNVSEISFWYLWEIKMISPTKISFWCLGMTSLGYLMGCHKDVRKTFFRVLCRLDILSFRYHYQNIILISCWISCRRLSDIRQTFSWSLFWYPDETYGIKRSSGRCMDACCNF